MKLKEQFKKGCERLGGETEVRKMTVYPEGKGAGPTEEKVSGVICDLKFQDKKLTFAPSEKSVRGAGIQMKDVSDIGYSTPDGSGSMFFESDNSKIILSNELEIEKAVLD